MSIIVSHVTFSEKGELYCLLDNHIRGYAFNKESILTEIYCRSCHGITCLAVSGPSPIILYGTIDNKVNQDSYKGDGLKKLELPFQPMVMKSNEKCFVVAGVDSIHVYLCPQLKLVKTYTQLEVTPSMRNLNISSDAAGSFLVYAMLGEKVCVTQPFESASTAINHSLGEISYITISSKTAKIAVASKDGRTIEILTKSGESVVKLSRGSNTAVIDHMFFDNFNDRLVVSGSTQTIHVFRTTAGESSATPLVASWTNALLTSTGYGRPSYMRFELPMENLSSICYITEFDYTKQILAAVDKFGFFYSYAIDESSTYSRPTTKFELKKVPEISPMIIQYDDDEDFDVIPEPMLDSSSDEE